MRAFGPVLLLVGACAAPDLDGEGLVGESLIDPFPNRFVMEDGKVAVPPGLLPVPDNGSEIPVERIAWREGFSPAQVAVARLPEMDGAALPMSWRDAVPGEGPVLLVDLDEGRFLGVLAELDAHPDADDPVLLIRPLETVPPGHSVAAVITTDVAPRPERFHALIEKRPPEDLEPWRDHYRGLMDQLEELGVARDDVALAWDWPVGDGTTPLRSALDQLDVPGTWQFSSVRDADEGDRVAPHTWRAAEGSFGVQDFLVDGLFLDVAADGAVSPQGADTAYLYAHVPDSVKDAPAGTVPVLVFGHGIFGHPELYLDDMADADGVLALADEGGFIVVATKWVGFTDTDRLDAIDIARDFGRMPALPDRLVQAQVNQHTLVELVRDGALFDDPVFLGASGQRLADSSHVAYHGISLGGIEGAVLIGSGADVDAAVFHAGGGQWSTMLERSLHWIAFEFVVEQTVEDPAHRQLLYAASQLFWDPVDPVSWTAELSEDTVLWQECIGDEQVPNLTTELLARSVGAEVLQPAIRVPWGVRDSIAPVAPALAQFDPEVGEPPDENRPPRLSDAHTIPRVWAGSRLQAIDFLSPDTVGTVTHHCGASPCSATNPGPVSR